MTLSFPRDMPNLGEAQSFELDRVDFRSREGSGRQGAISGGQPLWRMEFQIGIGKVQTSSLARAFVTSQEGGKRLFYGYDLARKLPFAYRFGTAWADLGWNGIASSWSQSVATGGDNDGLATLTLNGLPPGLVITENDYVGFKWTNGAGAQRRALVRFAEAGVANGGGVFSGVISPAVPTLVPSGATATMNRPDCLMRLDMDQTKIGMQDFLARSPVTIAALQDFPA